MRDEAAVMNDIRTALQDLGHIEFVHAQQRDAVTARLRELDAELGLAKLAAAQAQIQQMAAAMVAKGNEEEGPK